MQHTLSVNKARNLGKTALESTSKKKRSPEQIAYANLIMDVCDEHGLSHPFEGDEKQTKQILKEAAKRWDKHPLNNK